ncbi:glycosyltransferase family 4 protein [Stenomitos frigidus]|uniref:Glycosyltransferase n=1 Tax=Stenomitos frigidus ULC18 TaxID=2107698 RepID=A0A2T1E5S6_9CYAN|nr:glycosyltransferase family 4 protein [Stenomitos frigidus]PSB28004.1 glycosyltransferase [Stenomitos frigidus ULC18]
MHIAWLGKKSPFCGNVTYGREVTNALLDRGHQVSFFHFAQAEPPPDNWPDFQEISIPFLYKSQIYTIPTFKSSKILAQALYKLNPDVVHASLTLSPLDFLLPEICLDLGIPLVATFHPPFDRKPRNLTSGTQHLMYQLYAPFLAKYDRVIIFSHIQEELLIRLGVPASKLAVIPNGVDVQKYSPGPSSLKAELDADRIFVYQGRIAPEKNIESLLKAWKHCRLDDRTKLVIVGNHGSLAASLMPFYGPEHGIVWLGFIADEAQRINILRGSDVFVLPSLVEGLSLSLLEAMACGLACIATDAGADGEVLEDEAGVILKTQSVATQLKTLLPQLCEHTGWTTLLGQNARQRVKERYTLTDNITHLESLYEEVLRHQPAPLRQVS